MLILGLSALPAQICLFHVVWSCAPGKILHPQLLALFIGTLKSLDHWVTQGVFVVVKLALIADPAAGFQLPKEVSTIADNSWNTAVSWNSAKSFPNRVRRVLVSVKLLPGNPSDSTDSSTYVSSLLLQMTSKISVLDEYIYLLHDCRRYLNFAVEKGKERDHTTAQNDTYQKCTGVYLHEDLNSDSMCALCNWSSCIPLCMYSLCNIGDNTHYDSLNISHAP